MELNEKKLKKILVDQRKEYQRYATQERKEYQRYLGALKEDFESQVKLIAESILGIQDQLIAIRDMVAKNTEDIEIIRNMVAKNTENIEIMKVDINFIKGGLKKKVDFEEFEALGKRVAILEAKLQQG